VCLVMLDKIASLLIKRHSWKEMKSLVNIRPHSHLAFQLYFEILKNTYTQSHTMLLSRLKKRIWELISIVKYHCKIYCMYIHRLMTYTYYMYRYYQKSSREN